MKSQSQRVVVPACQEAENQQLSNVLIIIIQQTQI